jgi:glycine/D-amino acid oxidase-like deaminating enzyme
VTSVPPWRPAPALPPVALPARCDVAIIGAGPAGLCAGLLLAREGVDVVVLEGEEQLGRGAFGQGPGLAMGWLHDHPHRLEQALGVGAEALLSFIGEGHALAAALLGPEHWRSGGGLLLPGDEREAAELRLAVHAANAGDLRLLEPPELRSEHGVHAAWAGCARSFGALFDPAAVLAKLASEALAAGVVLALGCPVLGLDDGGSSPILALPCGPLSAELVLLCGGLGGMALDPSLAAWSVPVRHSAMRVELPGALGARCRRPVSSWFGQLRARPLPDGAWLLAGGRVEPGAVGLPAPLEAALLALLCAQLGGVADGARVSHRWTRDAAHTRDGLPLVGPVPGRVRRILCTGFCDHDADLAFAAARAACEGVLGRRPVLPACLESRRLLGR